MSWYNAYSDNVRKLESLIDTKPTLQQLLEFPDFIELLKAYQPKLLEYISNSSELPKQMIRYIIQAPKETDSDARKYKLPLQTVLMIQTGTTCVINSFFKINPNTQKLFFLEAFEEFLIKEEEILPLLCGYFSQINVTIWNNRYKQAIDVVYDFKTPLILLAKHCYSKAIINTLLLYLNLDLTRNPTLIPERTQLKLQVIRMFFDQIKNAFESSKTNKNNQKYQIVVENICDILIEIVQKYYLITDGKNMLDVITSKEHVDLILNILMSSSGMSLSVVGLCIVLMRYFCLSSFNQEDPNNLELSKKNQQRLETQPFIKKITELVPIVCSEILKTNKFTLRHSRILEVFIPIIELSSTKLFESIKSCHFLESLISLLFRWPLLSIVHKQVERVFMAIFCLEKRICQNYRKHLFCYAGLIQLTAGQCIKKVTSIEQSTIKPGWFSFIMKIVRVYSKIQTNDEEINSAIMQRATLWEKFSSLFMRPYEAINFKDLGSYEGLPDKMPLQYSVRTIGGGLELSQTACQKVVEAIIQEESMQQFLTNNMPEKSTEESSKSSNPNQDALFSVQEFQRAPELISHKSGGQQNLQPKQTQSDSSREVKTSEESKEKSQNEGAPVLSEISKSMKSPEKETKLEQGLSKSFSEYLSQKKQEIGQQLALQRRSSSQKRLSAHKSRVTSPSPKKKRWDDSNNDSEQKISSQPTPKINQAVPSQQRKQKISLTYQTAKPCPIPHQPKSPPPKLSPLKQSEDKVVSSLTNLSDDSITKSVSFEERKNLSTVDLSSSVTEEDSRTMLSKSEVNLSDLKHIQFKRGRASKPTKSEFRKIGDKDKVFLHFLGVKI